MATAQHQRIEMRVDIETKQLAKRAAAVRGSASMTEFIISLIRENAPKILEQETAIHLSNAQFDRFIEVCNETERKPSERLLKAAQRLDNEGF
jgi:uncharacterized protein (DUF1778 family)